MALVVVSRLGQAQGKVQRRVQEHWSAVEAVAAPSLMREAYLLAAVQAGRWTWVACRLGADLVERQQVRKANPWIA